jgi:hypothetical protein
MKSTSNIRVLALFSLVATMIPVAAMAQGPAHFKVPFAFTAGQKSFAAGEYNVGEIYQSVLSIQSTEGNGGVLISTLPGEPVGARGSAETLTFHRYGDRYFLCSLAGTGRGWALPKSQSEKELIAARAAPQHLEVLARK